MRFALLLAVAGWSAACSSAGDADAGAAAGLDGSARVFDSSFAAEVGKAKDTAADASGGSDLHNEAGPAADTANDVAKDSGKIDGKADSNPLDGTADAADVDDDSAPEPDAEPAQCGDGICGPGETWATCSLDCAAPPSKCGDLLCTPGENLVQCPIDCDPDAAGVVQCLAQKCKALLDQCLALPKCVDALGNGAQCAGNCGNEDCMSTCIDSQAEVPAAKTLAACGFLACTGADPGDICGDGACSATETKAACPADCGGGGGGAPKCTDGICDGTETAKTCPMDCDTKGKLAWQCGVAKCPKETADCQADPKCIPALLEAGACLEKCGSGPNCTNQCQGPVVGNSAALALAICGIQNCQNP